MMSTAATGSDGKLEEHVDGPSSGRVNGEGRQWRTYKRTCIPFQTHLCYFNLLGPELFFFLILAHPVYKM